MTQSRSLGVTSSALVLLLLLGTGMAKTCTLTLSQLTSGAAECIGGIYAGVANDGNVQALTAAAVAEMGLPSQVSGPMTYVTAAALLQPRIAEVIGFVRGGLGCTFTNASVDQTASAVWAGVKMIFQAHCSYVAPVISSCMRNVSQPATCGSSTSYVTNATNSLLGMYCNTTTWQFNENLSAGLAYEIQQVVSGMCSGSKVPAAVSDPIFADLANAGNLLVRLVSGGAFSANDVVGLLLSSATNGSLSWLDLRSLPQLASNVELACKSQLPAVASLTLGLPSNSSLLDAVGSLCDGLAASLKNVSTPAQLALAVARLVGDATTAVSNVASAAQFAEALAKVAFGPAPAGNLTAVANMSYQAAAAVVAALADVTGSELQPLNGSMAQFDPVQAVVHAVVGAALDPNGYTCGLATRLGQLASGSIAALAPLSKSGNLVAAELLRMASNSAIAKALIDAGSLPGGCTPAVAAGLLRQLSGSALVPANCTITGYDSIVACLTADDAAASSADGASAALDRLRDALTYALLTGLQNATRAPADLARLTGVSGLLNNTLPHLSNLTEVLAQVDHVAMAVAGQFASAFAAPIAVFASANLSSPWQYVDAALAPVCNVTRQAAAAVDVALAQQAAGGNYVARDLLALARSPMALTLSATVQNATQQVCDCSRTALAGYRGFVEYMARQRLPANDSTKIIQFACDSNTPVNLFSSVRGAMYALFVAGNQCAASAIIQLQTAFFSETMQYVLNATRMGCDEYALGQALYAVFDKAAAKPFNVYTDPYGFLNFFLNQAAWDGFAAASQKTFSTFARAGNVAAIQTLQLLSSAEFRYTYGYFDNATTTIRSFVSLFTKTCLRSDMQSSAVSSVLYGYYGLTQEALDTLRCGSVDIGRCAMRAMNKASGGVVDSLRGEIASGSAVAAYVTGLPFLNVGDVLAYNEPTNDYSPKAKTAVVAFFGGGWTLSAAAPSPKKCSEVSNQMILITNRNYTLTRSYNRLSGVESVDLTFYAIDKSGAQSSVARYSVKSDLNSGPLKTAPVTLTNSAGKAVKTSQGYGFNVALTVNATSKLVKIIDSVSKAGFAFYVNPKTRNVAVVMRGTKAAIQTSFGSFVCGCLNSDPTAKLIGTPRPLCFVKCSARKQTVCKPAECAAVKQYQYAGLDVVDYMKKTT